MLYEAANPKQDYAEHVIKLKRVQALSLAAMSLRNRLYSLITNNEAKTFPKKDVKFIISPGRTDIRFYFQSGSSGMPENRRTPQDTAASAGRPCNDRRTFI